MILQASSTAVSGDHLYSLGLKFSENFLNKLMGAAAVTYFLRQLDIINIYYVFPRHPLLNSISHGSFTICS